MAKTTTTSKEEPVLELQEAPGDIAHGSTLYPFTPPNDSPVQSWNDIPHKLPNLTTLRKISIGTANSEQDMVGYKADTLVTTRSTSATGNPTSYNSIPSVNTSLFSFPPPSPPPPVGPSSPEFFGVDGFSLITPGTYDSINSIVLQSDGKILAGGLATISGNTGFVLTRYNSDGSLDTSFDTDGYNLDTPSTNDQIYSIVLQSDGKIVAGGVSASGIPVFAITRYNSDGSLDTSFGNNGYNLNTPGSSDQINSIVLQSDGKIVAGGTSTISGKNYFVIARYNSDGSLDTSFGTNGFSHISFSTTDYLGSIALQSDGKIVAVGSSTVGGKSVFCIARYNSNGSIDASFNTNGRNLTTPGTNDGFYSIVIQTDGKILAGGYVTISGNTGFVVTRYNSNGSLDTSFGTNGYNSTSLGPNDTIYSLVLQPDGKILAGGFATVGGNTVFAVARYNSDGSLDTSFGIDGFNDTTPGTSDWIYSTALQSDGRYLAGGFATVGGASVFAVARYNPDGSMTTGTATLMAKRVTTPTAEGRPLPLSPPPPGPPFPPPLGPPPPPPTTTTTTHKPTTTTTTTTTHAPAHKTTTTTTHPPAHKATTTTTTHKPATTTTTHAPAHKTTTTTHKPKTHKSEDTSESSAILDSVGEISEAADHISEAAKEISESTEHLTEVLEENQTPEKVASN